MRKARKLLSKMTLEQRPPASGRIEVRDTESPLVLRLTAANQRTLCVRTRIGGAKGPQRRLTYPKAAVIENLSDARTWARQTVDACKAGTDPRQAELVSDAALARAAERAERLKCDNVIANYIERRVRREKNNRTADDVARLFEVYVTPRWRGRLITDIDREEVNALLDDVFDRKITDAAGKPFGGNVMADRVLAHVRACFNWWALQDGKFTSPIVQGMARTNPRSRIRSRVLSDLEIRLLWPLLAQQGIFGALVKTLFLSAQRRDEVADMVRTEIARAGIWTIPASRYKSKRDHLVPLPKAAMEVIKAQPVVDGGNFVFTTTGNSGISGFSKAKKRLDTALLGALQHHAADRGEDPEKVELPNWRLHDLRRTAKTLMARAGVRPDISERVLGHVIPGVEGVYDHFGYIDEKREALEALAAMIGRIVSPPASNVVILREAAE